MEYELSTLKDVFDKVPTDRILLCLEEIGKAMVYNRTLIDIAGLPSESLHFPETSTWVDDGKGKIGTKFYVKGETEPMASVMWEPEAARPDLQTDVLRADEGDKSEVVPGRRCGNYPCKNKLRRWDADNWVVCREDIYVVVCSNECSHTVVKAFSELAAERTRREDIQKIAVDAIELSATVPIRTGSVDGSRDSIVRHLRKRLQDAQDSTSTSESGASQEANQTKS